MCVCVCVCVCGVSGCLSPVEEYDADPAYADADSFSIENIDQEDDATVRHTALLSTCVVYDLTLESFL